MSNSYWTWHNLWNFLITINFKYKYFHNSVDWSGLYQQVHLPSWLPKISVLYVVLRLLENAFVKLPHHWHDLIINPPCKTAPQKKFFFPIFHEKWDLEYCQLKPLRALHWDLTLGDLVCPLNNSSKRVMGQQNRRLQNRWKKENSDVPFVSI